MLIYSTIPQPKVFVNSVFVYPTETCYGLGCNAMSEDLVRRIYSIKGRSFAKPLSWIVSDRKMAEDYVEFSEKARALAERLWPGGATLVLPLKKKYARIASAAADGCIGIRVSPHPFACEISRILQAPIVATSANVSGNGECYSIQEVSAQFANQVQKPDFAIDYGILPHTVPTTVARVLGDTVEVLRQGEIYVE